MESIKIEESVTVAEAAQILTEGSGKNISTMHVYNLIKGGHLKGHLIKYKPNNIFLSRKEVEDSLKPELKV